MTRRVAKSRDLSLRVSLSELNRFNKNFGKSVAAALDFDHQRYLSMEKLNGGTEVRLDYGLEESGSGLTAIDDRGMQQSVVHFSSHLQQHLLLALSFSWRRMSQTAQFRQIQILLFLAWGSPDVTRTHEITSRKQLLRLEWEGVDELGVFEAKVAAHPHWQTDQWLAGYDRSRGDLITQLIQSGEPREFALHRSEEHTSELQSL